MNSNIHLQAIYQRVIDPEKKELMDRLDSLPLSTLLDDMKAVFEEMADTFEEMAKTRQMLAINSAVLIIPPDEKVSQNTPRDVGIVIERECATLSENRTQSERADTAGDQKLSENCTPTETETVIVSATSAVEAAACQLQSGARQRSAAVEEVLSNPRAHHLVLGPTEQ
jgi:hypothetical protein